MILASALLALSLQVRLDVGVTVRAGSPEEQERLNAYATKAKATVEAAFPKILKILDYSGRPRTSVQIIVANDLQPHDGKIAWTNFSWDPGSVRGEIFVPAVSANPGDMGMMVHELMHVVQVGYKNCPSWLDEGMADHMRYYFFDPPTRRPQPNPNSDARESYGITAAFLNWASRRYQPNLIRMLDLGLRTGEPHEQIFQRATKRSLDQLNAEWKRELQR